jgi:hypothetical protein
MSPTGCAPAPWFLDGPGRSVGTGVLGADKMTLTVEK